MMSAGTLRPSDLAQLVATMMGLKKGEKGKDPADILDRALASVFDEPEA